MSHTHGALAPAATCASVALDIGDGRGALVLYPSERFRGREIEISRADGDGAEHRVHTGVHERRADARSVLTAIFGSLPAGDYLVWEDEDTAGPVVTVPDCGVAEVRLG
jgi:hypothetical protein